MAARFASSHPPTARCLSSDLRGAPCQARDCQSVSYEKSSASNTSAAIAVTRSPPWSPSAATRLPSICAGPPWSASRGRSGGAGRRGAGTQAVHAALHARGGAAAAGVGPHPRRAPPPRRDLAAAVGEISCRATGWIWLQPVLRSRTRVARPLVAHHAADPPGRGAAVRRLCRADGRGDRRRHWRGVSTADEFWFSRTLRAVWPCTLGVDRGEGGFTFMVVCPVSSSLLSIVPARLDISRIVPTVDHVTIEASLARSAVDCPGCGMPSRRLHSHYHRVLSDLPWQGRPATIRVTARRFRCLNFACARWTFAERLGSVAPASARRTARLGNLQRHVAFALGGEAASRLTERLAVPTSPDTLLRMAANLWWRRHRRRHRRFLAWMTGLGKEGIAMAPSSSTSSAMRSWTCCRIGRPRRSLRGFVSILGSRSLLATAQVPTPMESARARRRRFRCPTAGTCCEILAMPSEPSSIDTTAISTALPSRWSIRSQCLPPTRRPQNPPSPK